MRIVDCHVHTAGQVDPRELLAEMDRNGVQRVILFSEGERFTLEATREKLQTAQPLTRAQPDRISVLAFVNPTIDGMADLTAEAVEEMGFIGVKIIPDHWFTHEQRLEPFWERMNELKASILFHTGILHGHMDSSRFCRPVYLEKLLHYPDIRFAMAHISWPWCEECLAVMGRMRAAQRKGEVPAWQSWIDLTPGTPPYIRRQAVANAVEHIGPERIMFGTDCGAPGKLGYQKALVEEYLGILRDLGLDEAQVERIMSGSADEVFPARGA